MSPKRKPRQPTKSVTIYNSAGKRERKMAASGVVEPTRNSVDNWEFHFNAQEIEMIKNITKMKEISGVPLIIGAIVLNQKDTVLSLLKHGYDINEPDKNHVTALAWAVKLKHLDVIQCLLENNADSLWRSQNGEELACMALSSAHWDEQAYLVFFSYLKTLGTVNVNALNKHGLSLLHLAVRREWNSLVDVLIQNDVNVNISTSNGVTPLMLASYRNDFAIITRLLSRGASVKRRNEDGFTALCYAFSSAIAKELEPPFLVVDKLQIEMAKIKIDLPTYLRERVKLLLVPTKEPCPDQPSPEQMLAHIFTFILKNIENGFELLSEVNTGSTIKAALDKYMEDKINLRLPLIVLNAISKHLTNVMKIENLVLTEFIDTGCFDLCLKGARMHADDPMILQLAITPIIIFSIAYHDAQDWYDSVKDDIIMIISKYEICMDLIDASQDELLLIHERLDDFNCNICNLASAEVSDSGTPTPERDSSTLQTPKKAKRRTKALKAKIAKTKTAELTERFNLYKIIEADRPPNVTVADATSDEETLCANAVKMATALLDDDAASDTSMATTPTTTAGGTSSRRHSRPHFRAFTTTYCSNGNGMGTTHAQSPPPPLSGQSHNKMAETGDSKPTNFHENSWQHTIQNLPFQANKVYKPVFGLSVSEFESLQQNPQSADVDIIIKYLENLLGIIVARYKDVWQHDKTAPGGSENEFDYDLPSIEGELESIQSMEKEQLRYVHREFYNLTRNVREAYDSDPDACFKILKELEKYLITHNIRGGTIIDEVAALETVKVNVTMPEDYPQSLPNYMEGVLSGEIDEDCVVKIEFKQNITNKNVNSNMGDFVYSHTHAQCPKVRLSLHDRDRDKSPPYVQQTHPQLNHAQAHTFSFNNLPPRAHLPLSAHTHTTPSFNIWEDDEDAPPCCRKGHHGMALAEKDKASKWCGILRSLEMMDDWQTFLNGSIRLSNAEKRQSFMLSLNGNFSILEIGLTTNNKPIAVKILPKSDPYAVLLKNQVDPLLKLRHKYILSYHTCKYENNLLIVATPLCEYNLGQYVLKMRQPQSQICKVSVIRQLLSGLMYLHNQFEPVVHGNLKPSNVLVDIHGTVKVAEFGIYKAKLKNKLLPESTIIWFASELYRMYKKGLPLVCTCASDIQVAGMLVHFTNNGGAHPFGCNVPDILKHLVEGTVEMTIHDMELHDLLTWMLMGEPSERPSIHQVLSHIFFWSKQKKWTYILVCAGFCLTNPIPMDVEKLHSCLDAIAAKEKIAGNCWVMTAKKQYPELCFANATDTPSGLLRFIKDVVGNNLILNTSIERERSFSAFVLNAFPHFVLTLYRMIENSEWSDHSVFLPFHNVADY